jgi:hypothetical protein
MVFFGKVRPFPFMFWQQCAVLEGLRLFRLPKVLEAAFQIASKDKPPTPTPAG